MRTPSAPGLRREAELTRSLELLAGAAARLAALVDVRLPGLPPRRSRLGDAPAPAAPAPAARGRASRPRAA